MLLGSRVRAAFGWDLPTEGAFETRELGPGRRLLVARLPHPSGRCRLWNPDPAALDDEAPAGAEARAFFSLLLRWLREDEAPLDLLHGARRDPAATPGAPLDEGRACAPTLAALLADVEASGAALRGPPAATRAARDLPATRHVLVAHVPREPCEGCGRPWVPASPPRLRHLCPACCVAGSGHGL